MLRRLLGSALQQPSFSGLCAVGGEPTLARCFSGGSPYALNALRPAPGATRKGKRVGRGRGGGKGKTCGRGHKGRTARSGRGVKVGFEGGQTPMVKRQPKVGFSNARFSRPMESVNLGELQLLMDKGRLVPGDGSDSGAPTITMKDLYDQGIMKSIKHGVKVLGDGAEFFRGVPTATGAGTGAGTAGSSSSGEQPSFTPVHIEVSQASASAIEAIEAAGSTVVCKHYNRLALRALLKPEKFDVLPRRAKPPPKLMAYYLDDAKRGEFSQLVQQRKLQQQ